MHIEPWAYVFGAFLALTVPLDWLLSAFAAALVHEISHICAIKALGGSILCIRISIGGAVIDSYIPGKGKEFLCALAGPAGSLLLISLCHIFPKLTICALIQCFFNLLPVYPLDGGRMLRCLTELLFPASYERILFWAEKIIFLLMLLTSLVLAGPGDMGFLPIVAAMVLIMKKKTLQRRSNQGTIVLPFVKR